MRKTTVEHLNNEHIGVYRSLMLTSKWHRSNPKWIYWGVRLAGSQISDFMRIISLRIDTRCYFLGRINQNHMVPLLYRGWWSINGSSTNWHIFTQLSNILPSVSIMVRWTVFLKNTFLLLVMLSMVKSVAQESMSHSLLEQCVTHWVLVRGILRRGTQ